MTRPVDTAALLAGTGRSWDEWLEFMKSIGAQALAHAEIAQRVEAAGASSWWAQMITVAYEQHIGRRVPGQTSRGDFQVQVSRTLIGSMDAVLDRWQEMVANRRSFDEVPISGEPSLSASERWRYWRVDLADGSRITATMTAKSGGKVSFAVTHEKLDSPDSVEQWRGYWRIFLDGFQR